MKKIPMELLKETVETIHNEGLNALAGGRHDIHPDGHYFRASSSGMCMRKAMFAYLQCAQIPRDPASKRTLFHGTEIHKWADDGVDMALWGMEGSMIRLVPWRMASFKPMFLDTCNLGVDTAVAGTLDHLYLVNTDQGQKLVIIDHKSANEFAFKKYKGKGAPSHHRQQVGTYAAGVLPLARQLGLKREDIIIFMVYLSKKDLEVKVAEVDEIAYSSAEMYWANVATLHRAMFNERGALRRDGVLPPAEPFEGWECRYCDYCDNQEQCSAMSTIQDLVTGGLLTDEFVTAAEVV